jgi:hypothetical protein
MTVEPPTVLRVPGLVLDLEPGGTVRATSDAVRPQPWLVDAGGLTVHLGDGPLTLGPPQVRVDVDEIEVERSGSGLRTVVRHALEQTWTVRVVLANETDAELTLERVHLGWRAAPGTVVTALAAGARAAYAVQPAHGDGPVLVGRLRSGLQQGVDATGLQRAQLVLGPRHRWAVQWRWEVVPDVRRAATGRDLPRTTWLDLGQSVVLPSGLDEAVVAPGLSVELEDDRMEVDAAEPGSYVLELRAARGTTAYPLTWAPDLDDLVDARARELLAGRATPAGTPRLQEAAAGLVVQDALARRTAGPPDELVDALELVAGELVEELDGADDADIADIAVATDPLTLAFLVRETDRTGVAAQPGVAPLDVTLLDVVTRRLLETRVPVRGLGLAGVGLALAHVRSGRAATGVVAHLAALLAAAEPGDDAALELALLLRPRDGVADEPTLAGLRRLGATLGAGLPGRVVPAAGVEAVAYASTLLGLVDEPTGHRLQEGWGVTAAELARRTAAQARARSGADDAGQAGRRALAWLVLGRR